MIAPAAIDTLRAADLSALCEAAAFMADSTIGPEALLWGRAEVRLDEAMLYIRQAIAAHDEAARVAGAVESGDAKADGTAVEYPRYP
jgi:hypothetical protein